MRFVLFSTYKKNLLLTAALMCAVGFLFFHGASSVYAQTTAPATDALQNLNSVNSTAGLGSSSLGVIIGRIINILFGLLGAVVISFVIYGGYLWMTAAGDEKQVTQAKDVLKNTVIGLVIIASSYAITSYIMSRLFGAGGLTGGTELVGSNGSGGVDLLSGYDGGSALGRVIESHDPARDAVGVPRNKMIQVVYKFPIDPTSVIDATSPDAVYKTTTDANGKEIKRLVSGPVNGSTFLIYATAEGRNTALKPTDVWVTIGSEGADSTVVVYDPIPFLGSATAQTPYTVELSPDIKRVTPAGQSIFSGFSGGYSWKFTVSTELDLTPPRIISVIPTAGGTYARNITVQVTFSEPVNLASAVGEYDGHSKQFKNIRVANPDGSFVSGVWRAGGGFNIIDFTTAAECGTNACGQKIFCLPASEKLEVRALSGVLAQPGVNAQVNPKLSLQGITDTAGNALDGGGENAKTPWSTTGGKPSGSPVDDFYFSFNTTDATKITDPKITSVEPLFGANGKDATNPFTADSAVSATFDSLMKASSFSGVGLVAQNPRAQAGFWKESVDQTTTVAGVTNSVTKLNIKHVSFAKSQSYAPALPSSVQDVYQNCFLASGQNSQIGLQCTYTDPTTDTGTYTCCNGVSSNENCNLLEYGKTP